MPRKNDNARQIKRARQLKVKPSHAVVIVQQRQQFDNMSPGILVAVAEWRPTN